MTRFRTARQQPLDVYLNRLKDHLSILARSIDTIQNEHPRAENHPQLQSRMTFDLTLAQAHLEQIEAILSQYDDPAPYYSLETVSSVLSTVSSLLHGGTTHDVLSNALAAAGYKAHQVASYDALIVLARHLGFQDDLATLERLREEEHRSAEWLEANMQAIVERYLTYCT